MREIKFRAWLEQDSKMIQLFGFRKRGRLYDLYINDSAFDLHDHIVEYEEYVTLMQSTGMKDKNGKEIYEGDIVNAIAGDEYGYETGIRIVVFSGIDMGWSLPEEAGNGFGLPLNWGGYESLEVLGNIYENSELLKQTA